MAEQREKEVHTPLVSVIMPAYNSSETLADSIQSVLGQTFTDWELLVIDDCSPEPLKPIVDHSQDARIRYIRLEKNSGVAQARNRGIQAARGRYIAFLDSDDLWLPEKLEKQLQFMQENGYAFTYTWYRQFSKDANQIGNVVKTKSKVDYQELLKGNDTGCLTVIIDHQQVSHISMPSQRHEDYITWLNILKQGITAYSLPIVLAKYRTGKKSLTSNKWRSLLWTWQVYRESQHLPLFQAGICMVYYIYSGLLKHYIHKGENQ